MSILSSRALFAVATLPLASPAFAIHGNYCISSVISSVIPPITAAIAQRRLHCPLSCKINAVGLRCFEVTPSPGLGSGASRVHRTYDVRRDFHGHPLGDRYLRSRVACVGHSDTQGVSRGVRVRRELPAVW